MPDIIEWPCSLLRPLHVSYFIQWGSRDAGANLHGIPQVITPGVGVWRVDITVPRDFDGERLKLLEAKVSQMRGRYNVADLCICDPYKYGAAVSPAQMPFSDGTWFDDGTGFADGTGTVAGLAITASVAAGANLLNVNFAGPPAVLPLRVGDMFSSDGFLYRVTAVNGSNGNVRFEPSARKAMASGTLIQTDPPRFFGRFIDDNQGMRTREYLKWGSEMTLSFIEAFDR